MTQKWPDVLWIVRHGESAGNVARDAADAAGLALIDIDTRDVDVPLSELGVRQSASLGRWFASRSDDRRPTVVLSSPYLRAQETARIVRQHGGVSRETGDTIIDERLREKEFGILDRLTRHGITQRFPEQAELRRLLGKFYHRPPGGESWCDVILRLRSMLDTITLHYCEERVLLVCHQVIVLCMRYLIECMTEDEILLIDQQGDVANCAVTTYEFDASRGRQGKLVLTGYNFVAPLEEEGTPVTTEPDAPVGAK